MKVSENEILKKQKKLKIDKAPETDCLHTRILKGLQEKM